MNAQRIQLERLNQGGFGLVEAMVVASILVFGFIMGTKTQVNLIQSKTTANQNFQANQLSNQKLEQLRTFQDLTGYANISSGSDTTSGPDASYTRAWTVITNNKYKQVNQTTTWTTSGNEALSISLSTYIAQNDPKQSGGLFNTSYSSTTLPPIGSGTPGYHIAPDNSVTTSTTDITIPGTDIVITYNQNNNVIAINQGQAVTISGTVSLGGGGLAPGNSVTLNNVTVTPVSNNNIVNSCSYTYTSIGNFSCIMGVNWSGTINIGGVSGVKVCTNTQQPYSHVLTSLNGQEFLLIKTNRSCPSSHNFLHQTL